MSISSDFFLLLGRFTFAAYSPLYLSLIPGRGGGGSSPQSSAGNSIAVVGQLPYSMVSV